MALQAFCGLRSAEACRIDWSAVDLAQATVTVGPRIAKTRARRVCPLPDCAIDWLKPYALQTGPVAPPSYRQLFTQATSAACESWPVNALRHTAISAKVALTKNLAQCAYESGNSPAVVQSHYNGLSAPETASAWFNVRPTREPKIVRMIAG